MATQGRRRADGQGPGLDPERAQIIAEKMQTPPRQEKRLVRKLGRDARFPSRPEAEEARQDRAVSGEIQTRIGQPQPVLQPVVIVPRLGTQAVSQAIPAAWHRAAGHQIIVRILAASTSMAKGLVITCMPGSSSPLPIAAFSA